MATPAVATRWIETIYLQSAVKTDATAFKGAHGAYFAELMERQKGAKYFIGDPTDGLISGQCLDTYAQVMNSGFPAGLLGVDEAIKLMNQACYKG
jgi:multiple sugar transport system substrate-binding protein